MPDMKAERRHSLPLLSIYTANHMFSCLHHQITYIVNSYLLFQRELGEFYPPLINPPPYKGGKVTPCVPLTKDKNFPFSKGGWGNLNPVSSL